MNGQVCLKDIVGCTLKSLSKLTFLSFARQFCCNDGTPRAAQARAMARTRAANGNFKQNDDYEKMQFYYHPDHLGSSSYITNLDGEVSQHIEYVPFNEVFIEERNNTWNTPYLFNAKEFDEETGMYYYGARYYEPRLSLWMSADPLEEDYPNLSAYGYCHNNPIILYDPDGKGDYFTNSGIYLGYDKINDGKAYSVTGNFNMNLSNAIKVYKGSERGISKSALLYYSPRSMSRDKNGNPTIPKWDFNKLKEIYVAGVRASYIKMYTYKESKKKGQRK